MIAGVDRCDYTVGSYIDGKYRVVRSLGAGSYGQVWQVKDDHDCTYALKILKLWEVPIEIREKLVERFDMEYDTGQIKSPYLVQSFCKGWVGGNPYILMEFCPNGDLCKSVPPQNLPNYLFHILYGLKALHANGKVHRDLKPENVLIKEDGTAALTDYGISGDRNKRMTETNIFGKPTQLMGTYGFMPKEQIDPPNKTATVLPTTDIFSFGVLVFYLLTGKLPFGKLENQNDLSIYCSNVRKGEWNRNAVADSPYFAVIEGCLRADYKERLQSIDDVLSLMPSASQKPKEIKEENGQISSDQITGYQLRIMQGEEYGKLYDLSRLWKDLCASSANHTDMNTLLEGGITIGREDRFTNNHIPLRETQSTYISRCHCSIVLDSGIFKIRDGQIVNGVWKISTNGTYVNSKKVSNNGYYLSQGDIITIGEVKMRYEAY